MWTLVALLAGAALTLGQLPVLGQADDLDSFDDARLDRDLEAELDDIYEEWGPNEPVDLDDLGEAISSALSDDGDEGVEDDISQEELEDEMEEAGTTLEASVERGLQQADLLASGQRRLEWAIVWVSSLGQRGNGITTAGMAVRQVKGSIRQDVRRSAGRRQ
jgi:hypothetical protein